MGRLSHTVTLFVIALGVLSEASIDAQPTEFEVATIRPSGPQSVRGSDGGPGSRTPERYTFARARLLDLVCVAYDIGTFQIDSKIPLDRETFDLAAKMPAGTTKEQFRKMLQKLLAERFRLKLHIESREFLAYDLVVAKGGAKLIESREGTPFRNAKSPEGYAPLPPDQPAMVSSNSVSNGYPLTRLMAQREPLSVLLQMIRVPDNRPIVERTGITGTFDFKLEFSPDVGKVDGVPPAPDLITAIHEQLGLDLTSTKHPFDVVVIESVDRTPAEN